MRVLKFLLVGFMAVVALLTGLILAVLVAAAGVVNAIVRAVRPRSSAAPRSSSAAAGNATAGTTTRTAVPPAKTGDVIDIVANEVPASAPEKEASAR